MPSNILIVDDDPIIVHTIALTLEGRGYAVSTAGDGETALRMIAETRPDLILLDVMMPTMSGIAVLEKIRANFATASLPVMMLTAKKHEEDVIAALNLGVQGYVTKPFQLEDLANRVSRLLDTPGRY